MIGAAAARVVKLRRCAMDDTGQRRIEAGSDMDLKWLRSFVVVVANSIMLSLVALLAL
jgi:hypothetical protein